jgi:hypothetical protein
VLAQLGCYSREGRKPIESADGTTSAACERRPTDKSIQESELGLERFLSRWLRMYTGVQGYCDPERVAPTRIALRHSQHKTNTDT